MTRLDPLPPGEPAQDAGAEGDLPVSPPSGEREWPRVLALFLVTLGLSLAPPSVLIGIPFMVLLLALPTQRLSGLLGAGVAAFLVFGGAERGGLWYAERGWGILLGGWFAALTLRWPGMTLFARAAASVAGAFLVVAGLLLLWPGSWEAMDWLMGERARTGVGVTLEVMRLLSGGALPPAVAATIYRTMEIQTQVFPALVALASLASLCVAWWLYARLSHGVRGSLRPLREFRFNDQLVWVFIVGLLILLGADGTLERAGSNAVVFMGALYAARGAGVVLFMTGGLSLFGTAMLLLGMLFLAPVLLATALFIGLGDTWLGLRERARRLTA